MKKFNRMLAPIFAIPLMLAGCQQGDGNERAENQIKKDTDKIQIVTTFYPMFEFTKNVVGDLAEVELLIPSSIEPHDWEPSPKDLGNIKNADLFVYDSEYMETWVPDIEESLDSKKSTFVKASEGITLMEGEEHEHAEEEEQAHSHEKDPHVWLSPALAQKEVENIKDALIKVDPNHKEEYEKNSVAYIEELKDLDKEFRSKLADVSSKEIITQHAAFGYLANEYGLKQVAIAGLSPENEPSPAKLAELKNFALDHNIKTIFFEEVASPKVAKTLADEIGAETQVLNTLEGLSEENQKKGADYIQVMQDNLDKLKGALSK
ncbi:metal ABC transporter substrate-binding protein [Peribacillus frigoritolerans]